MTDLFSLLGQPRNPWLEADVVKQAFVSAAADVHPDRVHDAPEDVRRGAQERYTLLNEAQLCLATTRTRVRHFLELEREAKVKDLQEIPEELMQLFGRLGAQLRAADQHCRDSARAGSPLLKVALFAKGEELRENLQETQGMLKKRIDELENMLRSLGRRWERTKHALTPDRDSLLDELEALYRLLSFHERWQNQVQSRLVQLMEQMR